MLSDRNNKWHTCKNKMTRKQRVGFSFAVHSKKNSLQLQWVFITTQLFVASNGQMDLKLGHYASAAVPETSIEVIFRSNDIIII